MEKSVVLLLEELMRIRKSQQRNVLSQSNLHVGQPAMLSFVRQHPGCSQKQMADESHVTPASIASSFKRLENTGLILRRTDTADTRCNRVYITRAGERELDFCQDTLAQIDLKLTRGLERTEIEAFENTLRKMIKNLDEAKKE